MKYALDLRMNTSMVNNIVNQKRRCGCSVWCDFHLQTVVNKLGLNRKTADCFALFEIEDQNFGELIHKSLRVCFVPEK